MDQATGRPSTLNQQSWKIALFLMVAGEHPKVVQERLGHSSIRLTMDTYTHVIPGMQERATERLDALLTASRKTAKR